MSTEIKKINGQAIRVRFFTTAQVKKIDDGLADTGSSQEPGFYWAEHSVGWSAMVGPFKTAEAAFADAASFTRRVAVHP